MDKEIKESFVKDKLTAILGSINGIFLYDLLWPFLVVVLMKLVLLDKFDGLVDNHYSVMSSVLMIISMLATLTAAIFIANPKRMLKAYDKFKKGNIKLIFISLGYMFLFSYIYNLILLTSGVDITGGNANQENVVSLISEVPILSFISMVILAPILEEITYRYFLYGGIAKYNRNAAIVISGFIFMAVHAIASFSEGVDNIGRELLLLPPYMFSGMVLAYAYDKSENLLVSTSIHALNNLISFIVCFI